MRVINECFKEKFKQDFKFIIDFVKENDDVFLGIRNNCINLYANGGSFFKLEQRKNNGEYHYIAALNAGDDETQKGYYSKLSKSVRDLLKEVNEKELTKENSNIWNELLSKLKSSVAEYMIQHKVGNKKGSSKEKILQQNLALAFNNSDSDYYNCDIEYNVEGLNDYYVNKDGDIDRTKDNNPHTLGRVDNIVIGIKDNKLKIYLFELKEGMEAIKGTNFNSKSQAKTDESFGNGVIGHIKCYMTVIKHIRENKPYISLYAKDYNRKHGNNKKVVSFDIRNNLVEEIKGIMSFYQEFDLIKNNNFKDINYENIVYDNVSLVFYLGGYNLKSNKLEKHLGIVGNNNDSVLQLINNNPMIYKYLDKDEIYDFRFYKDAKVYSEKRNASDLVIDNYSLVKVIRDHDEVSFKVE